MSVNIRVEACLLSLRARNYSRQGMRGSKQLNESQHAKMNSVFANTEMPCSQSFSLFLQQLCSFKIFSVGEV